MANIQYIWRNHRFTAWRPNLWDVVVLLLVFVIFVALVWGAKQMATPYKVGQTLPVSLALSHLPIYAIRTILRLLIALVFSLLFTFVVGTLAAKNKHARRVIIPLIDIMQSVPVLGFLAITVVWFIALFPNSLLGPECAAIFVIFTAQAWNMMLGFYQSLCTLPQELREVAAMLRLSFWQRFWQIEVPFALPSLIWNMMLSLSASWFFVVASEAIAVNHQTILLPGIGSYIATAIACSNKTAILGAIIAMIIVIVLYDQILFRPLICWSQRFKIDRNKSQSLINSWFINLLHRTRLWRYPASLLLWLSHRFFSLRIGRPPSPRLQSMFAVKTQQAMVSLWYILVVAIASVAAAMLFHFIFRQLPLSDAWHVIILGAYTALRVIILVILCSIIWVPVGVWIGLNVNVMKYAQPIVQILAAFPANLVFPIIVSLIITFRLNVNIWLTPLMILGAQWYILFNVIAGANALPRELHDAANNVGVKGWLWWKRLMLPAIFPYYITGAITAAGGAWNASIVAEIVTWGHTTLQAQGLGAYITQFTITGDFPRLALGLTVMCSYVLLLNRLLWQPLYHIAYKRYALD